MLTQNRYYSFNTGTLPEGCQMCVRGEKLVLFVTGLCPRSCYFCPISDQKYQHDIIFANERSVQEIQDVITEAKTMDAKGAGITGGDPLMRLDRTCEYIKALKQNFGPSFHIHLYTSLNLVTREYLQKLFESGLDEIRFHLDLESEKFWNRLLLAREFPWKVGVEVPCITNKKEQLQRVLDYTHDKVDFINLNELEIADNSQSKLSKLGFKTKDPMSYAIEGSLNVGKSLITYARDLNYTTPIHCCTATLKDKVQLANRLKREAQGAKKPFDKVHKNGLLERGALYLPELEPGVGYRRKVAEIDKDIILRKLTPIYTLIMRKLSFTEKDLFVDIQKPRILLSVQHARKFKTKFQELGLHVAIVKEYPTADQLEIEVDFLN